MTTETLPDEAAPESLDDFGEPGADRTDTGDNPTKVELYATLVEVKGVTGSTAAGATGSLKFQIDPADAATLLGLMGEQAFDVIFDQAGLGKGMTIRGVAGRPDAEGAAAANFSLLVPTTEIIGLAACFTRGLIGKHGKLVLDSAQLGFDLTARAE